MSDAATEAVTRHAVTRQRFETRRRNLSVAAVEELAPKLRRFIFHSNELDGFVSLGFDDHVKLFFPDAAQGSDAFAMRDFTPRSFDIAKGEMVVDFVVHAVGPASDWARVAQVGSKLAMGGPRGSMIVPDDFDWYLLAGDETAYPAIGRRLAELRPDVPVHCVLLADAPAPRLNFETRANSSFDWIERGGGEASEPEALVAVLAAWNHPPGDGFVFVAAEAETAQAAKAHLLQSGHNPQWLKASGYWTRGAAGEKA
jgi:NADPH-dependent ferric siderophore reductase